MKKLQLSILLLSLVLVAKAEVPTGAVDGVFYISETQKVYFSQGALIHDGGTWSFTTNQYDRPTAEQGLFAWGTSGYGNPDTIPAGRGLYKNSLWDYSNFDWGVYNSISNGGNTAGLWRTLTGEEWRYLYEHYDAERVTIEGVAGYKLLANDGEHYLFLPDGDYWASTSSKDLVDDKTTAEACQVKVAEEGGLSLLGNASRAEKMMVRLVYETNDPGCLVVSDQRNNSPILAKFKKDGGGLLDGQPVEVEVIRSLTPNMSNTLTLPFDVAEDEMAEIFGTGYELLQLNTTDPGSIDVEAQAFDVNLVKATSIEAGVPYLITPTQPVNNMHFYDRVIKKSSNDECVAGTESDLVEFHGLLDKTHLTAGDKTCLFLYPNNTLVWSAENDNSSMNSLRAYFKVNTPSSVNAPLRTFAPRMVVTSPSVTTDNSPLDAQSTIATQVAHNPQSSIHKILKDGQLMIVRDTIVLNLFGQRIK